MKKYKNKRGVVLMVVITAIVSLVVIVQQMGFDTYIEFQNGSTHYHSLKAYHSAKSGLGLAVLKIMVYKKIQRYLNEKKHAIPSGFLPQIQSQLNLIWAQPLVWPPILELNADVFKKDEIQSIIDSSLFDSNTSYNVFTETEGAKLDLSDLGSPHSDVRKWARQILFNLLINLRNEHFWIEDQYSENELKEVTDNISLLFNPSSASSATYYPSKIALMNINDLLFVENVKPELVEFLKPYVTIFGESGINLQFIDRMLFKSLHKDINDQLIKEIASDNIIDFEIVFSSEESAKNFFNQNGMNFMIDYYFTPNIEQLSLSQFVFNFDAPQNFKIISFGKSNNVTRGIEAVIYDPFVIRRSFRLFELKKDKEYTSDQEDSVEGSENPDAPSQARPKDAVTHNISPFIIHWKDID